MSTMADLTADLPQHRGKLLGPITLRITQMITLIARYVYILPQHAIRPNNPDKFDKLY